MTRKKQHKDAPIMESNKRGYSLISNRQLMSIRIGISLLANSFAKKIRSTEDDVIDAVAAESDSYVASLSDEQIQKSIDELITLFKTRHTEK